MGQKCENITIRPSTPESNFVNGDKSVPKGWKISSHKEEDGRSWVICPQVRKYQNQLTNHNWTSPQIPNPIHLCRYIFLLQGQKYKSRRAAFKSLMEKDNLPSNEKDQMLKCLSLEVGDCNYGRNIRIFNFSSGLDITRQSKYQNILFQGWTKHPDLPKGWRLKRLSLSTEGKPKGRFIMAADGSSFDRSYSVRIFCEDNI